jgi:hypothetical protein
LDALDAWLESCRQIIVAVDGDTFDYPAAAEMMAALPLPTLPDTPCPSSLLPRATRLQDVTATYVQVLTSHRDEIKQALNVLEERDMAERAETTFGPAPVAPARASSLQMRQVV